MSETAAVPPAAPAADTSAPTSTPNEPAQTQATPVQTAAPQQPAPAPEPVVNQSLTTQPEAQDTPSEKITSVLGDALGDPAAEPQDYNYDYDDIQLEDGVVGTDADKATTNAIAKELGLSREQARMLYQKGGALLRQQQASAMQAQIEQWNTQVQADPEIGGANLEAAKADFRKAMSAFGSPELRQLFREHPVYQVPALFKFMAKAGRAISGDSNFTQGTNVAPRQLSEQEAFLRQFPNSGYLLEDNFNK